MIHHHMTYLSSVIIAFGISLGTLSGVTWIIYRRRPKGPPIFKRIEIEEDDHECDEDGEPDIDICRSCGEHAGFCSECGASSCCN